MEKDMQVIVEEYMEDGQIDQLDIEKALQDAAEGLDELKEDFEITRCEWEPKKMSVRTLLKKYKENKLKIPLCQRLYVWTEAMRKALYRSIPRNRPCSAMTVIEIDDTYYLIDGLQRMTSLMLLSNDKDKFTPEQRKEILDYNVLLIVVTGLPTTEMKDYFSALNSGMALAAVVKQRSQLSDELNDAILQISSNSFFRETPTNTTFNKSQHNELIALNTLLAVAGCEVGDNKAKSLCTRLSLHAKEAIEHVDHAKTIVERIATIYSNLPKDIAERSMNANFIGILVYVIVKNHEFSNENIVQLIKHIFSGKRAIKEYSATTSQSAGSENNCKVRYNILINLLNDPVIKPFDEEGFIQYVKNKHDEVVKDTTCQYMVAFDDFEECEQKALYIANQNGGSRMWNTIIEKKYKELEAEDVDEIKRESA